MIRRQSPTINQANMLFFIIVVVTLAGSAILQPKLGLGTNLWINEFVYILFPPLLLAKINGWSVEDVYRLRKTSGKNKIISVLSGLSLWFFVFYISKILRILLDNKIGVFINADLYNPSIYQNFLLIIGMIVLAPICEEILFRGYIQKAYEGYNKRFGFVITGIIFGSYHILNGISEVIPECLLGLGMGYLVYKTNSIATSMLFHAAANFAAVVMGGTLELATPGVIPLWLHIIAFVGLFLSVILIKSLLCNDRSKECEDEVNKENKLSKTGVIFLVLSAIFFIAVGVSEILVRLGVISV